MPCIILHEPGDVYDTRNEENKRSVDQLIDVAIQFPDILLEQRIRQLIENAYGSIRAVHELIQD